MQFYSEYDFYIDYRKEVIDKNPDCPEKFTTLVIEWKKEMEEKKAVKLTVSKSK